jgi:hypoxanthine-DNA glycosylase
MPETHPFGNFVPKNAKYLIIGSFPGKPNKINTWFYGNKRNQFWPILESVYKTKLDTVPQKKKLLKRQQIAVTDIIFSCVRSNDNNSDTNLKQITYNSKAIEDILNKNKIEKIFFTSRFVEKLFKKVFPCYLHLFPTTHLYLLPSPSPRYAKFSLSDKITKYKKLLPKL